MGRSAPARTRKCAVWSGLSRALLARLGLAGGVTGVAQGLLFEAGGGGLFDFFFGGPDGLGGETLALALLLGPALGFRREAGLVAGTGPGLALADDALTLGLAGQDSGVVGGGAITEAGEGRLTGFSGRLEAVGHGVLVELAHTASCIAPALSRQSDVSEHRRRLKAGTFGTMP